MKCRTNEEREKVQKLADERWAAHWAEFKSDPIDFRRRRAHLPPVIMVAYPRGGKGLKNNVPIA